VKRITYENTTKNEWAMIAYNFAMRICEDNQKEATKLLQSEKEIVKRNWRS
jgi:hypothetical protein